jgi:signal transduction histidine kinase
MTWSIRARLTTWYSLVVVSVLIAGAIAVALVQDRLALERLDGELERLMLTLEGVMRTEFGEGLDLQDAADEASIEVVAPDRTLVLTRADGALLAVWGRPIPTPWRPALDAATLDTLTLGGMRLRALGRPVTHGVHHYVAAVIAPLDDIEAEHNELLVALGVGVLVALAVAALGGWVVAHQSLRPLTVLAAQAASITDHDASVRLHPPHPDDELGRFAHAFNGLLDRLAAALRGQRQFMADASHELRTPVSVVRTTAQVILARASRPEEEYRESLTIVEEQSARLSRLVESMLLLSRAEADGIPLLREALYLDELVADSVRALRVLATARGVEIRTDGDREIPWHGDGGLLRQMVSNLLENAIRYAAHHGIVVITLTRTANAAVISVADDGEGIPLDQRDRIFDRFVHLDTHSGGAGLGLPIARWIAEAHGGTLVLDESDRTGSRFTVTLPC